MFFWIVKNIKDEVLFKTESYSEAYNYLSSFDEECRKDKGIFLDYIIEDWG